MATVVAAAAVGLPVAVGANSGNAITDWNLGDNWIADSGADAIRTENTAGWTIERNYVYGVSGTGINADRLFATSMAVRPTLEPKRGQISKIGDRMIARVGKQYPAVQQVIAAADHLIPEAALAVYG
ncbi:hypothetical protein ACFPIJ_28925 [Dactylosporangium cerinum]|uniref:Uncharacterized protein n=1 Tax=Dactylosporangium cerinum TaxID=1434730 RepID=A0ABV9W3A7_9ACTN